MDDRTKDDLGRLIQSITEGNTKVLDEINAIMGKVIFSIAFSILWNKQDAEDTVHDTYLMLVRKAKKFTYKSNAYAWVNTITKNIAKNKLKKRKNRKEVSLYDAIKQVKNIDENSILIKEIFGLLNQNEKDLMIYKYWYALSLSEIGRTIKKPKTTTVYLINKIESKIKKFYNSENTFKKS